MPKSKKPRKKSNYGREQAARRKWEAGNFKSVEDARATFRIVDEARRRRRGGCAQIGFMLNLANKERLIEDFTSAFFALDRWPTTRSFDDFNCVSSNLMLGLLCHKCLGVEEKSYVKEIQHAAFIAVVCVRECQDFCVWGGYSRGSPTRLPFVFEMQYARPDAIAGAKVEGPARSAGGSSLAPAIARREAAGALAREV